VSHNRLVAVRFLIESRALVDNEVLRAVNTIEIFDLVRSHVDEATLHRSGALHQACVTSKVDLVSYMLSIGMDVNTANIYGLTPLLCVVEHEACFNIISLLLSNGADVSLKSTGGHGPLGDTACIVSLK
jgi:ankyrin repeat protein